MAKPTKKDLLKARKKRDRKRQDAADRARAKGLTPWIKPSLLIPPPQSEFLSEEDPPTGERWREETPAALQAIEPVAARSSPRPPPRERTAEEQQIDRWWEAYQHADGETRLQMAREKLGAVEPEDEHFEAFFPEAISEVEPKVGQERHVAFLEEIRERWPRVFSLEIDWNVWQMAFVYVADQRWPDLERAVGQLAEELKQPSEPFFSLVSYLRLANREAEVRLLVDAAFRRRDSWNLMPWAGDELVEWALFWPCQEFVQAGADDEAFERYWQTCLEYGARDKKEAREHHRVLGLHLAGRANKRWTRQELLSTKERAGVKVGRLLADFQRWLSAARQVPPLVASELRMILSEILSSIQDELTEFLQGLKRTVLEPALARKLGLLSLDRFHVPAGILVMYHFYGFLAESELVDERIRQPSQQVCLDLWTEVRKLSQEQPHNWQACRFLEHYATWERSGD